jgi:hypothetical protein
LEYQISYGVCFCKLVIIRNSMLDKLPTNLVFMLLFYIFLNTITICNFLVWSMYFMLCNDCQWCCFHHISKLSSSLNPKLGIAICVVVSVTDAEPAQLSVPFFGPHDNW